MIAGVFVSQKTRVPSFDYKVPPGLKVSERSLVEVPFRNKKVLGVIGDLKPASSLAKREIIRPLSAGAAFTKSQERLAKDLNQLYGGSYGETLTGFLPPLAMRDMKKIGVAPGVRVHRGKASKRFSVISSKEERLLYFLQKIDIGEQNLLLLPTVEQISAISAKVSRLKPELNILLWHSHLSCAQRARVWQTVLGGKAALVIGSRQAAFLPFVRLGKIFIDDPTNFAYQEDQSPYYHGFTAAKFLSRIHGASLFAGDDLPDSRSFVGIERRQIEVAEVPPYLEVRPRGLWRRAGEDLEFIGRAGKYIKEDGRVVVVGPWRDQVRLVCRDCGWELCCEKCAANHWTQDRLVCVSCARAALAACPKCGSVKINQAGFSYRKIIDQLYHILPQSRAAVTSGAEGFSSAKKIVVLSPNEVRRLRTQADCFVFPHFDFMMSSPQLGAREKLFRLVRSLSAFSPREIFLFGEGLSESEFVGQLRSNGWRVFLRGELRERKKLALPPFTRAVLAVSRAKSAKLEREHLEKLSRRLPRSTPFFFQDAKLLFIVPHSFDLARLSLPASVHLEIDREDLA